APTPMDRRAWCTRWFPPSKRFADPPRGAVRGSMRGALRVRRRAPAFSGEGEPEEAGENFQQRRLSLRASRGGIRVRRSVTVALLFIVLVFATVVGASAQPVYRIAAGPPGSAYAKAGEFIGLWLELPFLFVETHRDAE